MKQVSQGHRRRGHLVPITLVVAGLISIPVVQLVLARNLPVVSLVATRSIERFETVKLTDLTIRRVARGGLAGHLLVDRKEAAGKVAIHNITEGSAVTSADLGPSLAGRPTYRIFGVEVPKSDVLDGQLQAGTPTNLIIASRTPGAKDS